MSVTGNIGPRKPPKRTAPPHVPEIIKRAAAAVSKVVGSVAASNMYDGHWMFTRRIAPTQNNGNECTIIGIRNYDPYEIVKIVDWLAERAAGYPRNPAMDVWPPDPRYGAGMLVTTISSG